MEANYYIGVDISKVSFDVSIFSSTIIAYKKKYDMTKEGFTSFFAYLKEFQGSVYVFMEPTGEYYINLANYLSKSDIPVFLVNQFKLKNYICANSLRKNKNDKKDSSWIARFGKDSISVLKKYNSSDSSELPQLMRSKEFLTRDFTVIKNRIRSKLNISFPELESNYDIFSDFYSLMISQYPSAYSFRNADILSLKENYRTKRGFKVKFLNDVYNLSKNSCSSVDNSCDFVIKSYFSIYFEIEKHLKAIDERIIDISSEFEVFNENVKILDSVVGVGKDSAIKLIAFSNIYNNHINDVFPTYQKWLAFGGTDPSTFNSGTSVRGVSRISKRGSRNLRSLAFNISLSLIKSNPVFREYYLRKKSETGKGKKYVFAVWTKFVRVAYHLLETRQMYKNT